MDRKNRTAVADFYNTTYKGSDGVSMGWTGNVSSCQAGTVAQAYQDATLQRVNFYRAMVGLPNVTANTSEDPKCQKAALMFSANNSLSHSPPDTWKCYSTDGKDAAGNSNIALGLAGPEAINGYMDDFGSGNAAAGHRRWVLYPPLSSVGTGSVGGAATEANSLWVIGNSGSTPSSPEWVAWPPDGYFPYPLIPSSTRWSFSYPKADFSGAQVTVAYQGSNLSVTLETVANGYGDNTLVWKVSVATDKPASDREYTVTLSNVKIGGTAKSFSYTVIVMDPASGGSSAPVITSGPTATPNAAKTGESVSFSVSADNATSYRWDFGDGSTGSGSSVTHTYSAANTYTVKVTASGSGGSAERSLSLTVSSSSSAAPAITSGPSASPNPAKVGQSVSFSVSADNATSYSWDFGDGATGSGATASHSFSAAGTYPVKVTVTGSGGSVTGSLTMTVQSASAPTVEGSVSKTSGHAPLAITGTASGTDAQGNALSNFSWDFGDGSTGTGASVTHTYSAPGIYAVYLTGTDGQGLSSTLTARITVTSAEGAGPDTTPPVSSSLNPLSLSVRINFVKDDNDKLKFKGTIEMPEGFDPTGVTAWFSVGNVVLEARFGSDGKATAVSGKNKLAIKYKLPKKGETLRAGVIGTLQCSLTGDFSYELSFQGASDAGLETTLADIPIHLILGGLKYSGTLDAQYKAKEGKSGRMTAKY